MLDAIATELVATGDFESEHWDTEDALDMLNELVGLAQLAESQGRSCSSGCTSSRSLWRLATSRDPGLHLSDFRTALS